MAELMFPNLASAIQQGVKFGTDLRLQREGEQRQNTLRDLASRAYAAPAQERQPLIQQAISTDPDAGFALVGQIEKREADQAARAGNVATQLLQAFDSKNPAQIQGVYNAVKPYFQQIAPPGTAIPDVVDDSIIPMLHQLRAAAGGSTNANLGDRFRTVGSSLIDLNDPTRPVYTDPRYIEGDQGVYLPTPEGLREVPIVGGMPPVATAESSGVPVRIGADVSPQDRAAILANPDAFAAAPDQGDIEVQAPPPSAQSTFRPKGSAAAERRLELAEESARRQAEAAERTAEATDRTAKAEQVKAEQSTRKEVSDRIKDQRTILTAYDKVKNTSKNPSAANDLALIFSYMKMLDPGSVVREGEFANAQNAAGVPDRVLNLYNNLRRGERLNPAQRQQFTQSAEQLATGAQQQIDQVRDEYYEIAEAGGLDPFRATGLRKPKAPLPVSNRQQPYFPKDEADFARLPSGSIYIDPDDGLEYRKP